MDQEEEKRLLSLLLSVEKEEREVNERMKQNVLEARRQLFHVNNENNFVIEDNEEEDDMVIDSPHNTDTDESEDEHVEINVSNFQMEAQNDPSTSSSSQEVHCPRTTHGLLRGATCKRKSPLALHVGVPVHRSQVPVESRSSATGLLRGAKSRRTARPSLQEYTEDGSKYLGKNGITEWNTNCLQTATQGRNRNHNVVIRLPGPKGNSRNVTSPIEAFEIFFPDPEVEKVMMYTNKYIEKQKDKYARERDALPTTLLELKSLLGLLLYAGIMKSSHQFVGDLWSNDGTGVDIYRCVMNQRRFRFLLQMLRFDDIDDRQERIHIDKLARIRTIFEPFVEKCKTAFTPSEYCTLDEMLDKFRGRCSFRQYMPKKPAKYGIKMFALCCARTFYTVKLEIYPGNQPPGPYQQSNKVADVVSRMVEPISGTGRNITMDNWFMSVPMADNLRDNYRLTVVGTIKKEKPELPVIFRTIENRPLCSSIFAFRPDCTVVSYTPKKNKVVTLLSTMHSTDAIDPTTGDSKKPEILTFYNLTKGGVDVVDEMKTLYSVSRISRRWPLTVFFSMINIGGINSYIIYKNVTNNTLDRRQFLKTLAWQLCEAQMKIRMQMQTMPVAIKLNIRQLFTARSIPIPGENRQQPQAIDGIGRCYLCGTKKSRRTKTQCTTCHNFVCREHTTPSCVQCTRVEQNVDSESD